jgi:hypothetical protein
MRSIPIIILLSESKGLKPESQAPRPMGDAGNGLTFHL